MLRAGTPVCLLCLVYAAPGVDNVYTQSIDVSNQSATKSILLPANATTQLDYYVALNFTIPSAYAAMIQARAECTFTNITIIPSHGEPHTHVAPDDSKSIINYYLGPQVTVLMHLQRATVAIPFGVLVYWAGYWMEPVHNYTATLTRDAPSWIPAPGRIGSEGEKEALVVSYPQGEDLCIGQSRHAPSNDPRYSPIFVYNGPSIYDSYVGTLSDVLGCSADRQPQLGRTLTFATARYVDPWDLPIFTLKSALDVYSLNSTSAISVSQTLARTIKDKPVTFTDSTHFNAITIAEFALEMNTVLHVMCGGLAGASGLSASEATIATITNENLENTTINGVLQTGCRAITLWANNGYATLAIKSEYADDIQSMYRRVVIGSRGVFVNRNWPRADPHTLYKYNVQLEYHRQDVNASRNMLADWQFTTASQVSTHVYSHSTIAEKNRDCSDCASRLRLSGFNIQSTVSGEDGRFRVDWNVVASPAAAAALSIILIVLVWI